MKGILSAGLLALTATAAPAAETGIGTCIGGDSHCAAEGCVTVGGACEYDARSGVTVLGHGDWKVEVWWNTSCDERQGDPDWIVASAGAGSMAPGEPVTGRWDGSSTDGTAVSCARATALDPTSTVAIGTSPASID